MRLNLGRAEKGYNLKKKTHRELDLALANVSQEQRTQVSLLECLDRVGQLLPLHVDGDVLVLREVDS